MLLQNIFQSKMSRYIIMIRFMLHLFKLFIIILQKAGGQMYCLTCDLTWSDLFANLKTPASLFVSASMHNLQHIFPQIIKKKNQYRFRGKRGYSQRYTYRMLQTIQMKPILLCVWAKPAIFGSAKTALKFKFES